jgi:hypothetical protein
MLKWFLGIGLMVVIAIGVGGYYLYANLDALVAQAIEDYGSQAAGVPVRVDRVELDLEAGRASIFGLRVSNPPGFKGDHAFTLEEVTVDIDLDSLSEQNPIVLDEILIAAPVVYYEFNEARQTNLDVLQKNASRESAGAGEVRDESDSAAPETRLRIKKLRFSGGRVEADTRAVGGGELKAKLATASLTNVGGTKGATGGEVGEIVVTELARQTALAVGKDQIGNLLKDQIGDEGAKAVGGFLDRFQ